VTTDQLAPRAEEACRELSLCKHIIYTSGLDQQSPFNDALKESSVFEIPQMDGDDPAVMIYTAGLTGKPLGAVLTHKNLLSQCTLLKDVCEGSEADRGLCVIPLFHSFGAAANMLAIVGIGASVVMMDVFHIDSIFKAIEKEKITYIAAVPRLFLGMLFQESAANYDLS